MTKKFAVGTKTRRPTQSAEFVVPDFAESSRAGFVGVKSRRRYEFASIVYTDKDLSTEEVLRKCQVSNADEARARSVVSSFLEALPNHKVGATVRVQVDSEGLVQLDPVELPDDEPKPKL